MALNYGEPRCYEENFGKLVTFYCNGDPHFKGLQVSINGRDFRVLSSLYDWLNERLPVTNGVRYVFQLPDGRPVSHVDDFVSGESYVASGTKYFRDDVTYGGVPAVSRRPVGAAWRWVTDREQLERLGMERNNGVGEIETLSPVFTHKDDNYAARRQPPLPASRIPKRAAPLTAVSPSNNRAGAGPAVAGLQPMSAREPGTTTTATSPQVIVVRSNTDRTSRLTLWLNPQTTQTFGDVLAELNGLINVRYPPVTAVYTAHRPFVKVTSVQQWLRCLDSEVEFLACGRESMPLELTGTAQPLIPAIQAGTTSQLQQQQPARTPRPPDVPQQPTEREEQQIGRALGPKIQDVDRQPDHHKNTTTFGTLASYKSKLISSRRANDTTQLRSTVEPNNDDAADGRRVISPADERRQSSPDRRQLRRLGPAPYRRIVPPQSTVKVSIHGVQREFYVPRFGVTDVENTKPDKQLKLQWVYGYQCRDTYNNLHVLPSGELVYVTSCVVVIADFRRAAQRHYTEHNENITSIAVHPSTDQRYVATAQQAGSHAQSTASIRVWDSLSLTTIVSFGHGDFQNSVISLCFSNQGAASVHEVGELLVAVDDSHRHQLTVWNWRRRQLIAKSSTSSDAVLVAAFLPRDCNVIVTSGHQHMHFWQMFVDKSSSPIANNNNNNDTNNDRTTARVVRILHDRHSGPRESSQMPNFVTSLAFAPSGDVIAGDTDGSVRVWRRSAADETFAVDQSLTSKMSHAHTKTVFALCVMSDGTLVSGGGKELKFWDTANNYRLIRTNTILDNAGMIRSVAVSDGFIFIGTTNNCIVQQSLIASSQNYFAQYFMCVVGNLSHGHVDAVRSVCTHPSERTFASVGYDASVVQWNASRNRITWKAQLSVPCRSIAYNPTGLLIAVGTNDGVVIMLDSATGNDVTALDIGNGEPVNAVAFSPDGTFLVVGSRDCSVYVFTVDNDGKTFERHAGCRLQGHVGAVTSLDWSKDSRFLRTGSTKNELMFWDVSNMLTIGGQEARDVQWNSQNCTVSYHTLGAWSKLERDEEINATTSSHAQDLLAVGSGHGKLCLYRYPCSIERMCSAMNCLILMSHCENMPEGRVYKPCSGHITDVQFTVADEFLISTGPTVMQWSVLTSRNVLDDENSGSLY